MVTNKRLTYKSSWGDYGCNASFESDMEEKCAFRNKLGKYEDADEWRPVSKVGYPKKNGDYIVTVLNPSGDKRSVEVSMFKVEKGYFNIEVQDRKVTAWKPFVHEPYTGE